MKYLFRDLDGLKVHATDGFIGKVEDYLFDDEAWTVRYLVVKTGGLFNRKEVLISPAAIREPRWVERSLHVDLTMAQIENSPLFESDKPVSRQKEAEYLRYFRWPYYWGATGVWAYGPYGTLYPYEATGGEGEWSDGDPHLRSVHEVRGYTIESRDEEFGQVGDFVLDDETWRIPYVAVDTAKYWPSKWVLCGTDWIDSVSWHRQSMRVDLSSERIKSAPTYDPAHPVTRSYEERLHAHYGFEGYWYKPFGPYAKNADYEQKAQRT